MNTTTHKRKSKNSNKNINENKDYEGWNFDNSYAQLPKIFFTALHPTPVRSPKLIMFNSSLANELGLDAKELESSKGAEIFSGNQIPMGSLPIAQAYAGHQFGYFTMLGDGRAILLGEHITPKGIRLDIQLKGSGRTPYSRGGDGRAALGPMLREYIISEAMYGLGIPTTRSLAVVSTGEKVIRDTELAGAILTRVALSHIRVGTFEYVSHFGTLEELRALTDYTLHRHFPWCETHEDKYLSLLKEVVKYQAMLISKWQLVGFIHGVMNTDNMAISGETIDYGPCAFMDTYNTKTVFSSIDTYGRYAYGNQPKIAAWNIARFAETLLPLIHKDIDQATKLAQDEVANFFTLYHDNWYKGMRAKLGLFHEEAEDELLINDLLSIMEKYHADYTNTFLALTYNKFDNSNLFSSHEFAKWHIEWNKRLKRQSESEDSSHKLMLNNNPALIPRNHRVEEALDAAMKDDYTPMKVLLDVLSNPYAHTDKQADFSATPNPLNCNYRTFCGT